LLQLRQEENDKMTVWDGGHRYTVLLVKRVKTVNACIWPECVPDELMRAIGDIHNTRNALEASRLDKLPQGLMLRLLNAFSILPPASARECIRLINATLTVDVMKNCDLTVYNADMLQCVCFLLWPLKPLLRELCDNIFEPVKLDDGSLRFKAEAFELSDLAGSTKKKGEHPPLATLCLFLGREDLFKECLAARAKKNQKSMIAALLAAGKPFLRRLVGEQLYDKLPLDKQKALCVKTALLVAALRCINANGLDIEHVRLVMAGETLPPAWVLFDNAPFVSLRKMLREIKEKEEKEKVKLAKRSATAAATGTQAPATKTATAHDVDAGAGAAAPAAAPPRDAHAAAAITAADADASGGASAAAATIASLAAAASGAAGGGPPNEHKSGVAKRPRLLAGTAAAASIEANPPAPVFEAGAAPCAQPERAGGMQVDAATAAFAPALATLQLAAEELARNLQWKEAYNKMKEACNKLQEAYDELKAKSELDLNLVFAQPPAEQGAGMEE
jgi:hypothetical protein